MACQRLERPLKRQHSVPSKRQSVQGHAAMLGGESGILKEWECPCGATTTVSGCLTGVYFGTNTNTYNVLRAKENRFDYVTCVATSHWLLSQALA